MNQIAVELHDTRGATSERVIFADIEESPSRRWLDAANGADQNADRARDSAQYNHGRMEARLLLPKIEEPVQANNRNGGPSEIQKACQPRRQTRRSREGSHGHNLPHCV